MKACRLIVIRACTRRRCPKGTRIRAAFQKLPPLLSLDKEERGIGLLNAYARVHRARYPRDRQLV